MGHEQFSHHVFRAGAKVVDAPHGLGIIHKILKIRTHGTELDSGAFNFLFIETAGGEHGRVSACLETQRNSEVRMEIGVGTTCGQHNGFHLNLTGILTRQSDARGNHKEVVSYNWRKSAVSVSEEVDK